jgi:cell division transport system permease protein
MSLLQRSVAGARRQPRLLLGATLAVAVTFTLAGAACLVAANAHELAAAWGAEAELVLYLEDGVAPARVAQLAQAVGRLPGVRAVRTVSPDEARARLQRSLGPEGGILDGIDPTLLPASLEAQLAPGTADALAAHPLLERLRRTPGVEEVSLLGEWTARLRGLARFTDEVAAAVLLACALLALFAVGAAMRLMLHARKDEIAVLRLCGATERFVRAPFLVEGLVMGVVGAALALVCLDAAFTRLAARLPALLGELCAAAPLRFFTPLEIALGVAFAATVGALAARLAVPPERAG